MGKIVNTSVKYNGITFSKMPKGHYRNKDIGLLHRYIWETEMQCSLLPGIEVHHKDKNPANNDLSNLQPMTHAEHQRYHNLGKKHSDASKIKMSLATKGKPKSEEHTKKIQERMRNTPSMLGKKHSEETKQKMRDARARRDLI